MALAGGSERSDERVVNRLMGRAIRLGQRGRTGEALAANTEGLEAARRLARTDPDGQARHAPVLASLLYNMAALLANTGRIEEAVRASGESADLYRQVVDRKPDLLPEFADALARHGRYLTAAGRPREALPDSEQAVRVYRRMSGYLSPSEKSGLARALVSVASALRESGQAAAAFGPASEAAGLYEDLPERPDELSFRADAAHELAIALGHRRRWAEALPLDARAISLYRRLAARGFEGLEGHLAAAEAALFIHAHAVGEPGARFVREFASGDKRLYRELYAAGETLEADQEVFAELSAKYGGITPRPGNSGGPPPR
jgi:tetratricopeptide (TPR) repeat protein